MQIEFTFSRDAGYFREQLTAGARLKTLPYLWGAFFAAVAGGAVAVFTRGRPAGLLLGGVLVAAGIVLLILRQRRIKAMLTVPDSWQAPRRWLLTDGGMASSTELTRARYAWSSFRTGSARSTAYLLIQGGNTIVDIPRQPLTAEQDAQLGTFLRARGLLAGQDR